MKNKMIKNLGAMIDVSRGAVMNLSFFKQMVDALSKMGYEFIEIYSEDIFDVKEEPFLGYFRGKYTIDELKEMDEYAASKGIELIPCIQTLAHFTSLSRAEIIYDKLFDIDDILLADSERTYVFIENIMKTCREAFKSNTINIGMDEAWKLGQGNYLLKNGYKQKSEIILKHLNRVSEIAKKYNYTCQMWSDMFVDMIGSSKNKDGDIKKIAKLIPDNVVLTHWNYFDTDKKEFDAKLDLHNKLASNVAFAGGTWCWRGFAPLNYFTLKTMEPGIKSCLEHNIETVIITLWGDDGNETSKLATLPGLFACAQFAKGNFDLDLIKKEFVKTFNVSFDLMMSLDMPNYVYQHGKMREDFFVPCKALFYQDPFMGKVDYLLDEYDKIDYDNYAKILKNNMKLSGEYSLLFKEEAALCRYLSYKAYLGYNLRKAYKNKDIKQMKKSLKQLDLSIKYLKEFKVVFEQLWLTQNKGYGLEIHDLRIGGLLERLKECKKRLQNHIKTGEKIAELEEPLLHYYFDDKFWPNYYREIVSTYIV